MCPSSNFHITFWYLYTYRQGKLKVDLRCETTSQTFGSFCKNLTKYSFFASINKILQTLYIETGVIKSEEKKKICGNYYTFKSFLFYNEFPNFLTRIC